GGYPELHAGRLAESEHFLTKLRAAAAAGKIIYGECGGYMVLGETLADASGDVHQMAGLLPLATSFAQRRRHLGYRRVKLIGDMPFDTPGSYFRGHEFHYASVVSSAKETPLFDVSDATGNDLGPSGLRRGTIAGSFLHLIDRES